MSWIFIIWSNTGMSFPRWCLPITEYCSIYTIKCFTNYLAPHWLINLCLCGITFEYAIECKIMRLFRIFLFDGNIFISYWRYTTFVWFLFIIERSNTNKNTYIFPSFSSRHNRIVWHLCNFYNSNFNYLISNDGKY